MKASIEQALALRHARHRLLRRAPRRYWPEVVRELVGLQAQVASAASLSLWARVQGITATQIDHGLRDERTIARTWCMRGTVHLIHREDHAWIMRALGPETGRIAPWLERRGITVERLLRLEASVRVALEGGAMSRSELRSIVTTDMPEADSWFDSWGGVLSILARLGVIVFGPPRANETTFVRCDLWWPDDSARGEAVALPSATDERTTETAARSDPIAFARAALLRRYLGAFGPASRADFTYWSGLAGARVASAARLLEPELATVEIAGKSQWLLARDLPALTRARELPPPRLLPHFDVALLGHRDKRPLVDPRHQKAVFRPAGWIAPTLLIEGRVAGTWSSQKRARSLEVTLAPFGRISRAEREGLEAEALSLARFLGSPPLRVRRG